MIRTSFALVVLVLAGLVVSAGAEASPVLGKDQRSQAQVLRYWSADRMRDAVPTRQDAAPSPQKGKGSGKGGGNGGGKKSDGSKSKEVPTPYPSAYGKVFFTDNRGTDFVCSGSAISSTNGSVVWTAGHCVNEGPGAFYQNFLFVPAYRDGQAPYGRFSGTALMTTSGWQGSGEFGVDVGAAIVDTNESGQTLSAAVQERSLVFNSTRDQSYKVYGYPAAKRFSGQRLRVCDTAWSLDDNSALPPTIGVPCDMTGGSSGGGWVTASGTIASVTSYRYLSLRKVLFGPHLETEAQQLFNAAQAG